MTTQQGKLESLPKWAQEEILHLRANQKIEHFDGLDPELQAMHSIMQILESVDEQELDLREKELNARLDKTNDCQ